MSAPVFFNNFIYVGDEDGNLHTFNTDGAYVYRNKLSSAILQAPVVRQNQLMVLTSNGTLYLFKG